MKMIYRLESICKSSANTFLPGHRFQIDEEWGGAPELRKLVDDGGNVIVASLEKFSIVEFEEESEVKDGSIPEYALSLF